MGARYDNIGGVQHKVSKRYDNINGLWRPVSKRYNNIAGVWRPGYSAGVKAIFNQQRSIKYSGSFGLPTFEENTYFVDTIGLHIHYRIRTLPESSAGKIIWRLIYDIPLPNNVTFPLTNRNVQLVLPATLTVSDPEPGGMPSVGNIQSYLELGTKLIGEVGGGWADFGYWVRNTLVNRQTVTIPEYTATQLPVSTYLDSNYFTALGQAISYSANLLYLGIDFIFNAQGLNRGSTNIDLTIPNNALEILIDGGYAPVSFI